MGSVAGQFDEIEVEVEFEENGEIIFEITSADCDDHSGKLEYSYTAQHTPSGEEKTRDRSVIWMRTHGSNSVTERDEAPLLPDEKLVKVEVNETQGFCYSGDEVYRLERLLPSAEDPPDSVVFIDLDEHFSSMLRPRFPSTVEGFVYSQFSISAGSVTLGEEELIDPLPGKGNKQVAILTVNWDHDTDLDYSNKKIVSIEETERVTLERSARTRTNLEISAKFKIGGASAKKENEVSTSEKFQFDRSTSVDVTTSENFTIRPFTRTLITRSLETKIMRQHFTATVVVDAFMDSIWLGRTFRSDTGFFQELIFRGIIPSYSDWRLMTTWMSRWFPKPTDRTFTVEGYIDRPRVTIGELSVVSQFLEDRRRPAPEPDSDGTGILRLD